MHRSAMFVITAAFLDLPIASAFVFGITTADPLTYLSAALTFLVVAIAAIVIPARRASRVDPITALHLE